MRGRELPASCLGGGLVRVARSTEPAGAAGAGETHSECVVGGAAVSPRAAAAHTATNNNATANQTVGIRTRST